MRFDPQQWEWKEEEEVTFEYFGSVLVAGVRYFVGQHPCYISSYSVASLTVGHVPFPRFHILIFPGLSQLHKGSGLRLRPPSSYMVSAKSSGTYLVNLHSRTFARPICKCWQLQTMNRLVDMCPLTEFGRRILQSLQDVDEDVCDVTSAPTLAVFRNTFTSFLPSCFQFQYTVLFSSVPYIMSLVM